MDLGNYERFLGVTLTRDHNITTGKVYSQVIHAERRGDYLGKTVQVIPHVTDAIQDWIDRGASARRAALRPRCGQQARRPPHPRPPPPSSPAPPPRARSGAPARGAALGD